MQSPSARGKGGEKKRKTKNKTKARKKVSCQSVSPSGSPLLATGLASGLCRSRLRRRSFQQDKKKNHGGNVCEEVRVVTSSCERRHSHDACGVIGD